MEFLPDEVQDPTILRRIIFAAVYLPKELPHYWSVVMQFASQAKKSGKTRHPEAVRMTVDKLQLINEQVFANDKQLTEEMHAFSIPLCSNPVGVFLISSRTKWHQVTDSK